MCVSAAVPTQATAFGTVASLVSVVGVSGGGFVFVGGQNGTWFEGGQSPRLYRIYLQNSSSVQLTPVSSVRGTVWCVGSNGSQLLVSGWGSDDASQGPYVWLYDGARVVTEGSLDEYGQASSWGGGDVFSASYNGKEWLLSGLGQGVLTSYHPGRNQDNNHMAMATFDGYKFTDLSNIVPYQQDAILYANEWNGQYWLVGGGHKPNGWGINGVLFTFDGSALVDLTKRAESAISNFSSVQSIGWNGQYWLIGGVGFLAEYDGVNFVDLTQQLDEALSNPIQSVNAIAWNGQTWLIGGGEPVGQIAPSHAWVTAYTSAGFVDLSPTLPSYASNVTQASSVLTIASLDGFWMIGGYSADQGILFAYNDGVVTDYSNLVSGMTYVNSISTL